MHKILGIYTHFAELPCCLVFDKVITLRKLVDFWRPTTTQNIKARKFICCRIAPNSQARKKMTLRSRGYSSCFVDRVTVVFLSTADPLPFPFHTLVSNTFFQSVADPLYFTSTYVWIDRLFSGTIFRCVDKTVKSSY